MKLHERINYILLGTLWCLAIVLGLDFWLNTVYNFNMFSRNHWQFVANLQAANKPIATGFYIAITIAITACIFGLYMLFRPRFRKIIFTTTPENISKSEPITQTQNTVVPEPALEQPTIQPPIATQPTIQRPPHLHIQMHQRATPIIKPAPEQTPEPKISEPRYTHEFREIFEKNKYKVLTPKTISNLPLSLIALGTNEILWLGAYGVSHEQMLNVMAAFKSVFNETLQDIDIDVNGFIMNPTDDTHIDAILDVKTLDELSELFAEHPNEPESESDAAAGTMDAFAGYIETVITYLGNK